jgi:ATP-dependent Lon protease
MASEENKIEDTNPGAASHVSDGPRIPEDALIIVPVRDTVLFPSVIAPVTIMRPKSIAAAQQALREQRPIGISLQRDPAIDDPEPNELNSICTVANIIRYITGQDGAHHLICQGAQRARLIDFLPGTPFPVARFLEIPEPSLGSDRWHHPLEP